LRRPPLYPFCGRPGSAARHLRPRFASATSFPEYYRALKDFTLAIPDGHIGVSFEPDVFFEDFGGSFGLLRAELSDGRVIVQDVTPVTSEGAATPASLAGIEPGAEILEWNGRPSPMPAMRWNRSSTAFTGRQAPDAAGLLTCSGRHTVSGDQSRKPDC
jgi:hypothetical protein